MKLASRLARAVPETYALNIPQVLHMLILAGYVPWLIGVEAYGLFAALVSLPGLVQSSFEAFCVAILAKYGRKDMLDKPLVVVMLPLSTVFVLGFFVLLSPMLAFLASAMTVSLFCRSYAFALAVSSGTLTRKIVESEGLILAIYLGVILLGAIIGIQDHVLPILMVVLASAVSAWYMLRATRKPQDVLPRQPDVAVPRLPLGAAVRAASARAYEDGLLTLSPLVLAVTASPAIAGQFRIFVSAVKAAYKFFPFRYEVVIRGVATGRQGFGPLALASALFTVGSLLIGGLGYVLMRPEGYGWLVALVAVSGAVVSSLSLYPVTCSLNHRLPVAFSVALAGTFLMSSSHGTTGFVVGFAFTTYVIMAICLATIRNATLKTASP